MRLSLIIFLKNCYLDTKRLLRYGWFMLLGIMLLACGGPRLRAPVVDLTRPSAVMHGEHVVQPGETLFSIAWRYGRDYRTLAAANSISDPYIIYPNQRISLEANPQPRLAQSIPITPRSPSQASAPRTTDVNVRTPAPTAISVVNQGEWQWPATGELIAEFSDNTFGNNGIDIAGAFGEGVVASRSGTVVYSGNGLRGYGNLIIIRHDNEFLSAYAHNSRILVTEGENVQVGEKIAEMGSSDTDTTMLHFEIRREGIPVDPLVFLAKN